MGQGSRLSTPLLGLRRLSLVRSKRMREVESAVHERYGVTSQPEIASGVDVRLGELGDTDVQHSGHAMRAPQPIAHATHVRLRGVSGR